LKDHDTDTLIQNSIRNELKDVTLITVAHRLQTIMDADNIMVLDEGNLIEFDTPLNLLKRDGGVLRGLVDHSGDVENLYKMAGFGGNVSQES
jgi:ABC-type multidrug transport system fused ATPase/permease subunit